MEPKNVLSNILIHLYTFTLRRFERCQQYSDYYNYIKNTSTRGIRIHILGPYTQVYSLNENISNNNNSNNTNKQQSHYLEKFFNQYDLKKTKAEEEPTNDTVYQHNKLNVKTNEDDNDFIKQPKSKYKVLQQDDDITLQQNNKLLGFERLKEEAKATEKSSKYKILQQNSGQNSIFNPTTASKPKVKTERDYLYEIISAQRQREQQTTSNPNNNHLQQIPNVSESQDDYVIKQKIKKLPPEEEYEDEFGQISVERSITKPILTTQPPKSIGIQCNLESMNKSGLYQLKQLKQPLCQIKEIKDELNVEICNILGHFVFQDENRKSQLVFQVQANRFASYEYLRDECPKLILDYYQKNSLL